MLGVRNAWRSTQGADMITATITSKGQITIPAEVRQALLLRAGDQIAFEPVGSGAYSFKPAAKAPMASLKGLFGPATRSVSVEEMSATVRRRAKKQHMLIAR
jgi:antitoxin PrlF